MPKPFPGFLIPRWSPAPLGRYWLVQTLMIDEGHGPRRLRAAHPAAQHLRGDTAAWNLIYAFAQGQGEEREFMPGTDPAPVRLPELLNARPEPGGPTMRDAMGLMLPRDCCRWVCSRRPDPWMETNPDWAKLCRQALARLEHLRK